MVRVWQEKGPKRRGTALGDRCISGVDFDAGRDLAEQMEAMWSE